MAGIEELLGNTYKGLTPMHIRTYLQAVSEKGDANRAPITEKAFTPEELYAMHDLMEREYNRVKEAGGPLPKRFSINDYGKYDDANPNRPYEAGIAKTLGRFNFTGDPEKGFNVQDNYNFIDEVSEPVYDKYKGVYSPQMVYEDISKQYIDPKPGGIMKYFNYINPQAHAEAYGLSALGKQGVPVSIHTTRRPEPTLEELLSNY